MLAYERRGTGEPLLLLHGIGHRRQAWYPVLDRLAQHYDVIAVDLPGHGESAAVPYNGRGLPEVFGEAVAGLLHSLGVERPHIAGNSLGGMIALDLAAAGQARSVTALSPGGFWRNRRQFAYTAGLFSFTLAGAAVLYPVAKFAVRSTLGRRVMFSWLVAHPEKLDPDRAYGDYRGMLGAFPAFLHLLDGAVGRRPPIPSDVPVTIAWAARDMVLPPFEARTAEHRLPQAIHLRMPGCGHVPMSDDPALVAQIILDNAR